MGSMSYTACCVLMHLCIYQSTTAAPAGAPIAYPQHVFPNISQPLDMIIPTQIMPNISQPIGSISSALQNSSNIDTIRGSEPIKQFENAVEAARNRTGIPGVAGFSGGGGEGPKLIFQGSSAMIVPFKNMLEGARSMMDFIGGVPKLLPSN